MTKQIDDQDVFPRSLARMYREQKRARRFAYGSLIIAAVAAWACIVMGVLYLTRGA